MTNFLISAPTWNDKCELPGGSYSISDIQDCFEYIKNMEGKTDNHPIRIHVNKIENRMVFRIKRGYYLELLTAETIKLLRSTKSNITKDENYKNVPRLEIAEGVLLRCKVSTDYHHNSRALHTFVPSKLFG